MTATVRRVKTPLAVLVLASTLTFAPATAVAATCTTVTHTGTAGILTTVNGEPGGPPSAATAVITPAGVVASLPDATSKVLWLEPPAAGTRLVDVADLSYRVQQLVPGSVVLPAFQLQIDPDPADTTAGAPHFTTLVYEPYLDGYGNIGSAFKTFDVDEPNRKWWSTKVLPLAPGTMTFQNPLPFAEFTHAYPRAVVLAYGWNFGKGSPQQKARVSRLLFATKTGCVSHRWSKPVPTRPTQSPTPSASQTSPSPTASSGGSPSASASTSTPIPTSSVSASSASPTPTRTTGVVPAGDEGSLPTTGAGLTGMLAAGLLMVGVGGFAVWRARRRHGA